MLDPFATPDAHAPENPNGRETEDIATDQPTSDSARASAGLEGSTSGAGNHAAVAAETPDRLPPTIRYPEWNSDTGRYLPRAVAVRLHDPLAGDDAWSVDMLRRHAALVRQVRHQFERLRARRVLLGRQRAGDDLDLAACVGAIVDRRIGYPPDDRLYADARPARRGLAISLLGDLYSVSTFAGKGAENVKLTSIKDFRERGVATFRRRVAGLEPGGFTRLGAAVRHATQELAHQSAGHRLLLILSDGRPNDVDQYQGSYGIEDSRQAILEARASGIFPFCLTVDRHASEYLPRIFGQTGHTILQRPAQLPTALLGAVRALIKRS
jgi:nitric oxide reductase NorD protein